MAGFFVLWFLNSPMQIGIVLWERGLWPSFVGGSEVSRKSASASRVGDAHGSAANADKSADARSPNKRMRRVDTVNLMSLDNIKEVRFFSPLVVVVATDRRFANKKTVPTE